MRFFLLMISALLLVPGPVRAQDLEKRLQKLELAALEFILPQEALQTYRALPDSEKAAWAARYWRAMDPTPTTPVNEYYEEFRKRLRFAYEHFRNLVPPYYLDDRARYYLRFGPPDDRAESVGLGKKYRNNMTWAYYDYNLFIDFVEFETYGYREVPDLTEAVQGYPLNERARIASELYAERADLSPRYLVFRTVKNDLQYLGEIQDFTEERTRAEQQAPPVTFRFHYKAKPLHVLLNSSVFRGKNSLSRVELYYLVPLKELGFTGTAGNWQAKLRWTLILYDRNYKPVLRNSQEIPLAAKSAAEISRRSYANQVNEELAPGRYFLAWRFENGDGSRLAILKSHLNVRPFPAGKLAVSDVQFAHQILLNARGENTKAHGIRVVPYISSTLSRNRPVLVYYEIYNLALREGKSHFRVQYEVEGLGGGGLRETAARIVNFIRGKPVTGTTGTSFETQGQTPFEQLYSSLDFSNTAPGKKRMKITVTDLNSGQQASVQKVFLLQ